MSRQTYEKFSNAEMANYAHQSQLEQGEIPANPQSHVSVTNLVHDVPVKWSWCNLVLSVFSLFCCSIFGVIATVTSILAYVDHKTRDYVRSSSKKNVAFGFGIAAIVIGSVIFLSVIIVVAKTVGYAENHGHRFDYQG